MAYNVGIYANIRCVFANNNFLQIIIGEFFVKKNAVGESIAEIQNR